MNYQTIIPPPSSPMDVDQFHLGPVRQFASLSSSSSSSRVELFSTTTGYYRSQVHGRSQHHEGGIEVRVWKKEDGIMRSTTKKREQPYSCSMAESDINSSNNSDSFPIRACADCSTTKTPLWRSGPNGPKSLCNACGIRQRKARRAMAMEEIRPLKMQTKEKKEKKKKKKKVETKNGVGSSGSEGRLEEEVRKVRKSLLGIQRVFPEDEKDAAILLMTLSLQSSSSSSSSSSSIIH